MIRRTITYTANAAPRTRWVRTAHRRQETAPTPYTAAPPANPPAAFDPPRQPARAKGTGPLVLLTVLSLPALLAGPAGLILPIGIGFLAVLSALDDRKANRHRPH